MKLARAPDAGGVRWMAIVGVPLALLPMAGMFWCWQAALGGAGLAVGLAAAFNFLVTDLAVARQRADDLGRELAEASAHKPAAENAAALAVSEKRLRETLVELQWKTSFLEAQVDSNIEGILVVDAKGRKILQNKQTADLFKIPRSIAEDADDERQRNWVLGVVKDPKLFIEKVLHLYAHRSEITNDELELLDGTVLDRYSAPIIGKDGEFYGRMWTFRDVTIRRADEKSLKIAWDRLRQATKAGKFGILDYDIAADRSVWDEQMFQLYGLDCNGGAPGFLEWCEFIHPEDRTSAIASARKAFETGAPWESDYRVVRRSDGKVRYVRSKGAVSRDALGKPQRLFGINWDVTEDLEKEMQLTAANRELVAAHARAERHSAEAKAANLAKSRFLAVMSHEIRSPLNSVIGMTELLGQTTLSPAQKRLAAVARASGKALLAIVNDILDFSKIESGKMQLETVDFDLRAILEETMEIVAVQSSEKGLDLACSIDPAIPLELRGDPIRLRQVLLNLAVNAVKFTACGEVILSATLESADERMASVRFAVSDTGIGIALERQRRLFSEFVQMEPSTAREYGGSGLGLAISKQLVELMGGRMDVKSEVGRGSTFGFTARLEKQTKPSARPAEFQAELAGLNVLVVEDHAPTRAALILLLQGLGCRSSAVSDAESALNILAQSARKGAAFQVALVDARVCKATTPALGLRIKGEPAISQTSLLLLTTFAGCGEAADLQTAGFADSLCKPVRLAQLREALVRHRAGDKRRHETPLPPRKAPEPQKTGPRVLVTDDDLPNRLVAVGMLEKIGCQAFAVASGAEAIRKLKEFPCDLVLMDCQMPGLDGLETTRRIRAKDSGVINPAVPIVAATAGVFDGDRDACFAAGMNDFVTKPIDVKELKRAVERWAGEPPKPPAKKAVFDREGLVQRLGGSSELVSRVVAAFLANSPEQIEELKAAIRGGDAALVSKLAHRIRGSAGAVGGSSLQALAFSIESAGKSSQLNTLQNLLASLDDEFGALRSALEQSECAASH